MAVIEYPTTQTVQNGLMEKAQSTSCSATQLNIQLFAMICIAVFQAAVKYNAHLKFPTNKALLNS
ncbi:hypothetical protein DPMN_139565 [Dreissena polymorpha]|uniref:Uncharacterized protein n=1 Tax=Dreissena polymorpha TaxID=45954 RepID=A0A9D4JI83_DREPO|nr:hypothetical protein DPMN_139565 [Dreissena polymorpha]